MCDQKTTGIIDEILESRKVVLFIGPIERSVSHLAPKEQRELVAYIVSLQTERYDEFKRQLAEKIDDTDPGHWVELNHLRKRLSE